MMKNEPIVVEQTLNAPAAKVWKSLTSKAAMDKWYFKITEFKPEPGFEFSFEGGAEDRIYVHLCKVIEVVPQKKLKYSWQYKGYPGNSFVTFELFPEDSQTRLKLTHEGVESFPADNPDFARKSFEMGWNEIIGNSIKEFVENNEVRV